MPLHYFDPDSQGWRSIQNPTERDVAEVLIATARQQPCSLCDADVEYTWLDNGVPDIDVTHKPGCPLAA